MHINKRTKIILTSLALLYIIYHIITFDYIEYKRNNIVNAQKEILLTLSGTISEKESELNSLKKELLMTEKCIEANSHTGKVIDCETIDIEKENIMDTKKLSITNTGADYWTKLDKIICDVGQINGNLSPLCGHKELLKKLKTISDSKGIDFQLLLGITYAESHLGANYAKGCDPSFNNLGGIKWRIKDDGTKLKDQGLPTAEGCYLYKFKSIEDYWESFSNSIKWGYYSKGCNTVECISKWWVKGDGLYKPAYNDRVNTFKF